MKRILVTGAGGAATLSFVRSLREAWGDDKFFIVGVDAGKYNLFRSEVDVPLLCPKAKDDAYIPFIAHIINKYQIDFIHSQPEIELFTLSKHRDQLMCRHFMPKHETVELLRDKWRSYAVWNRAGIKVPESMRIQSNWDLDVAFQRWGDIWLRETTGAAGKGSLSKPTLEQARTHLYARHAWGKAMAAEHLTDKTVTWQSIWHEGVLVVAQGRRRLYWEFANRAQSGVTGLTGTGETVSDPLVDEIAMRTVFASDEKPHGIFSVDMTYDWDGVPNPTEINIGKFFTTHLFITRAGCNMPEI